MTIRFLGVATQRESLVELAKLAAKGALDPDVRRAALQITGNLPARDDMGELEAIYDAVKNGHPAISPTGVRYVADPLEADFFTAPRRLLEECQKGACAGDCDDQAALVAALCGAVGFKFGLRAYGRYKSGPSEKPEYEHVFCVVGFPKRSPSKEIALDTTVPQATVGWHPPAGHVLTAWPG